ncbi:MAG: hypothetical protein LBV03_03375 [Fusobacteriales bacterium]|nr:hypothetical protein [Fusobacteriales bacterium]
MRRNNGFLNFFIFLIFLTYVFYLTYGFFKQRKEVTNNIVSKLKIRREDFYQGSEKPPVAEGEQIQEVQAEKTEADKNNDENTPEAVSAENQPENTKADSSEISKSKEENTETKTKTYIRVATYNKKTDADETLKKLDGDFKIRNSKTSSGKEVYIIISKTVSSNEELEKLKEKVKNYSYQIINRK